MTTPSIAIIGAGIGGLTLAAALRRFGIASTIYEQAEKFGPVGAGIQLTANSVKALAGLGLQERLLENGFCPELGLNRQWDTGEITNTLEMGPGLAARYGAPDIALHRSVLHDALAAKLDAGTIRLGKRLKEITQNREGVALTFEDGEAVHADAVVGADGLHSVVRRAALGDDKPLYTGKSAYRAIVPTANIKADMIEERVKWWGPDRHIVSYFINPDKSLVYFIAVVPETISEVESWSQRGDKSAMLAAFDGFHPRILAVLEGAEDVRKWGLFNRHPLERWSVDRITILGDACHPMPPFIAQGAASAIEDAVVLARAISESGGDGDLAAAFHRYEGARRERTARMQITALENKWMKTAVDADWVYGYDAWSTPLPEHA
ncbi:salicylate 1-monooxygenase [Pusillimonas caeni]|uniref:FAD-dependent monooxygenase n=1 Tax=Pusillimonas caeni TaxID=1348472 RepID=UPI000E59F72E|nr:FAD-dependent monooxygenase [Pusillimonas caeni]TFL15653.1 salicylate 1-monooxygenase [Pusillimonas caeni]